MVEYFVSQLSNKIFSKVTGFVSGACTTVQESRVLIKFILRNY